MGRALEIGAVILLNAILVLLAGPGAARADDVPGGATSPGMIGVTVRQNGVTASGSFEVHRTGDASSGAAGEVVATGRSGRPVHVAPGVYDVVVRLDGAIDRPEKWVRGVRVASGRTVSLEQSFATSVLEVRVTARGRRAAATIFVRRAGESTELATLGAGVRAVVSAGTYDIVVRHRSQEQSFPGTELAAGGARTLSVTF